MVDAAAVMRFLERSNFEADIVFGRFFAALGNAAWNVILLGYDWKNNFDKCAWEADCCEGDPCPQNNGSCWI